MKTCVLCVTIIFHFELKGIKLFHAHLCQLNTVVVQWGVGWGWGQALLKTTNGHQ